MLLLPSDMPAKMAMTSPDKGIYVYPIGLIYLMWKNFCGAGSSAQKTEKKWQISFM
jgi:hypothetical protein